MASGAVPGGEDDVSAITRLSQLTPIVVAIPADAGGCGPSDQPVPFHTVMEGTYHGGNAGIAFYASTGDPRFARLDVNSVTNLSSEQKNHEHLTPSDYRHGVKPVPPRCQMNKDELMRLSDKELVGLAEEHGLPVKRLVGVARLSPGIRDRLVTALKEGRHVWDGDSANLVLMKRGIQTHEVGGSMHEGYNPHLHNFYTPKTLKMYEAQYFPKKRGGALKDMSKEQVHLHTMVAAHRRRHRLLRIPVDIEVEYIACTPHRDGRVFMCTPSENKLRIYYQDGTVAPSDSPVALESISDIAKLMHRHRVAVLPTNPKLWREIVHSSKHLEEDLEAALRTPLSMFGGHPIYHSLRKQTS